MSVLVLAAALSLLAAGDAPARAAEPATAVAPVTVQARPLTRPQALKQSRSFVQAYGATTKIGQYARWIDPVCVLVLGLAPEQAGQVAARIDDVARAVGLKVDRPKCKANIEIVFTDQPQQLLDWVAARNDPLLGYHYPSQTKALKAVTRPIQAWYMTATRGGSGDNVALAFANIADSKGNPLGVGLPQMTMEPELTDIGGGRTPTGCAADRFTSCLQGLFKNVLVVVDSGRTRGRELGPIMDYLAMLALSQPQSLDGCAALPSVIDLFAPSGCAGRAPPDGLTPADAAYLTALYATDLRADRAVQQSDIAERMARIVVNAPAKPGPDGR